MNSLKLPVWSTPFSHEKKVNEEQEKLLSYYENAGPDYEEWSPNFNMHFGYYKRGMHPFKREQMLEQMNAEVISRLHMNPEKPGLLLDMGCGLAATMRHACKEYPSLRCKGITLVPWQKEQAETLNKIEGVDHKIQILIENYTATSIKEASADHIIAIESSCYAQGNNKEDLLKEIYRVLKPGGSFVIADGFLKTSKSQKWLLRKAYRQLCESWALEELGNIYGVLDKLDDLGFEEVQAQNISWNVAPSVAHVPYTVFKFLMKQLFSGSEKMNKERWDNLKSPLLTMVLGLHQAHFGYFLVRGRRPMS